MHSRDTSSVVTPCLLLILSVINQIIRNDDCRRFVQRRGAQQLPLPRLHFRPLVFQGLWLQGAGGGEYAHDICDSNGSSHALKLVCGSRETLHKPSHSPCELLLFLSTGRHSCRLRPSALCLHSSSCSSSSSFSFCLPEPHCGQSADPADRQRARVPGSSRASQGGGCREACVLD